MSTDETWAHSQVMDAFHKTFMSGTDAKNAEVAGTLLSMRMPKGYAYIGWITVLIGISHALLLTPWGANEWPVWTVFTAMAAYILIGTYVILFVRRHRVLYDTNGFHCIGLFGKIRSYHWPDVRSAVFLRKGRVLVLRTVLDRKVELYATMLGFKGFLAVLSKHCQIISRERGIFPGQWTEKPWQGL